MSTHLFDVFVDGHTLEVDRARPFLDRCVELCLVEALTDAVAAVLLDEVNFIARLNPEVVSNSLWYITCPLVVSRLTGITSKYYVAVLPLACLL
jgi:hypothetical protein